MSFHVKGIPISAMQLAQHFLPIKKYLGVFSFRKFSLVSNLLSRKLEFFISQKKMLKWNGFIPDFFSYKPSGRTIKELSNKVIGTV